jgi:hypothetical protein
MVILWIVEVGSMSDLLPDPIEVLVGWMPPPIPPRDRRRDAVGLKAC